MAEPVVIGNATLYLGDCLEILPHLPKVDAQRVQDMFAQPSDAIRDAYAQTTLDYGRFES